VYHNRRWDADFLTLKSLIERGVLGRIVSFESRFDRFRPEVKSRWREEGGPGGGILYDLGPHLIDQALHLFGQPDRLFADLARQRQGAMALDYFHLVLYYDAMRVVLHAGSLVNAPTARFAVHGDKGSFVKFGTDPQEAALRAGGRPGHTGWGKDPIHGELYLSGALPDRHLEMDAGRYQSYYEGIVAAIRRGEPPPVTAEDGLATIRLIEAALLSAEEGRVVTVRI
jgi:scyllo-inositol 2-dehydrogenase (NADP+)